MAAYLCDEDDRFFDWLAGFIDGEGSFTIQARNGGKTHSPLFALVLRADDGSILQEIHDRLGAGRLYFGRSYSKHQDGSNRKPQSMLKIAKKADLLRLVEVLDDHPLRAKKLEDYRIWRAAVLLWANRRGHRGKEGRTCHPVQEQLAELKHQLESARRWGG